MIRLCLISLLALICSCAEGQKYILEVSRVTFFSDAPIEDITAENTKASSIFDSASGDVAYSIPIREFQFVKSLMKEHFNERYMDSEQFPKSTFQGKIMGVDMKSEGTQNVKATGKLTVHGVSQEIDVPGTIEKKGDKLFMKSKFIVRLEDYKITIPQLMWQNIAEQVEVTLDFTYRLK
ncbi:MAG TPA: YceI family protein [Chryseolinea sp.]|nr:YceI family protein [Chryseolinea sp.]